MTLEQKVNSNLKRIAGKTLRVATRAIAGIGTAKWLFSTYPMYQTTQTGDVSLEWSKWAGTIAAGIVAASVAPTAISKAYELFKEIGSESWEYIAERTSLGERYHFLKERFATASKSIPQQYKTNANYAGQFLGLAALGLFVAAIAGALSPKVKEERNPFNTLAKGLVNKIDRYFSHTYQSTMNLHAVKHLIGTYDFEMPPSPEPEFREWHKRKYGFAPLVSGEETVNRPEVDFEKGVWRICPINGSTPAYEFTRTFLLYGRATLGDSALVYKGKFLYIQEALALNKRPHRSNGRSTYFTIAKEVLQFDTLTSSPCRHREEEHPFPNAPCELASLTITDLTNNRLLFGTPIENVVSSLYSQDAAYKNIDANDGKIQTKLRFARVADGEYKYFERDLAGNERSVTDPQEIKQNFGVFLLQKSESKRISEQTQAQ